MALIDKLNAIGDAIREKNGTTELIPFKDMPQAILDIVSGGGGTSLNIAFGDTPPEDTSKLWIKVNEPEKISYTGNIEGVGRVETTGSYLLRQSTTHIPTIAKAGNKLYIFRCRNVSVFDLDTKLVTDLGDLLPSSVNTGFCFVEGLKIYIIHSTTTPAMYVFDTETNTVTAHTQTPNFTKGYNAVAKVGNKIYSLGGSSISLINVFDMGTGVTTKLSVGLPKVLSKMSCVTYGEKIYLFGGSGSTTSGENAIYVFDTTTDKIHTLTTTLPESRYTMGSCRIGTKVYLFGGESSATKLDTIYVFDIEAETIEKLEVTLPQADSHISCYADGTRIYLFGGYNYRESLNVFVLTHELAQGNIEIEASPLKNKFNLINTDNAQVEIGVENVYIGNENNEAEVVEAYLHNGTDWVLI